MRLSRLAAASLLFASASALAGRDAHAAESVFVEGALGMGAPLGWAGASVVAVPTPALAVHAGAGLGSQSAQIAAGLRGRIALTARAHLSIGGGWSTGQIAVVGDSALWALPIMDRKRAPTWFWDRAHMVNLDLSFEHDTGGLIVRPFAGLSQMGFKRHSPLFSAVVLAGAALTAAQACGSEDDASTSATNPGAQDGSSGQDGQDPAEATVEQDGGTAGNDAAANAHDAASASDGHGSDDACPPDAEIPVPPCALIL